MTDLRPASCPISGGREARRVFVYDAPPAIETRFPRAPDEPYYREVWQFERSGHFVSRHTMKIAASYSGDYVNATYRDLAGIEAAFSRIVKLPAEKSDNQGRVRRVGAFASQFLAGKNGATMLDVGAGLGVFPYAASQAGWKCTALDPDKRAAEYISRKLGIAAVCEDFMKVGDIGRFDAITFNKVLEHVEDPIAMLARASQFLAPGGFVYVEVPDGEMAATEGKEREEFTIDHPHVFSFVSVAMLAERAGFVPLLVERLREPSTKFTLRMFCAPAVHAASRSAAIDAARN
jgi:2-polyprenyl-3-methyl-5-hydroxy-6-metoxy-1,4-benzoquinol methylase